MTLYQSIRAKVRVEMELEIEGYAIRLNKPLGQELEELERIAMEQAKASFADIDSYPHALVTRINTPRVLLDRIELLGTEEREDLEEWSRVQSDWPVDTEVWVPAKEARVMIDVLPGAPLVAGKVYGHPDPETWDDDEPAVVVRLHDQEDADPGLLQIAVKKIHLAPPLMKRYSIHADSPTEVWVEWDQNVMQIAQDVANDQGCVVEVYMVQDFYGKWCHEYIGSASPKPDPED